FVHFRQLLRRLAIESRQNLLVVVAVPVLSVIDVVGSLGHGVLVYRLRLGSSIACMLVTTSLGCTCIRRWRGDSCVAAMASFFGPARACWLWDITGVSYLCLLRVRALMHNRLPVGGLHGLYKILHRDRLSFRIAMVHTACISGVFVVHLCRRTFVDVRD